MLKTKNRGRAEIFETEEKEKPRGKIWAGACNSAMDMVQYAGENAQEEIGMNKWDKRFMELTETVAGWSSCYQENRHVGAVIVLDKRVLTTGYNGAPAGIMSCADRGECLRRKLNIASGTRQELCYAVHAEQNAIIQAARLGIKIEGATLYCTHQPCVICAKMIINAGIARVVYKNGYPDEFSMQLFAEANVRVEKYEDLEKE